jgi:hypothetical protein
MYDAIIDMASQDGWAQPRDTSSRITFYEKSYVDLHQFKAFVVQLKAALETHGTVSHGLFH